MFGFSETMPCSSLELIVSPVAFAKFGARCSKGKMLHQSHRLLERRGEAKAEKWISGGSASNDFQAEMMGKLPLLSGDIICEHPGILKTAKVLEQNSGTLCKRVFFPFCLIFFYISKLESLFRCSLLDQIECSGGGLSVSMKQAKSMIGTAYLLCLLCASLPQIKPIYTNSTCQSKRAACTPLSSSYTIGLATIILNAFESFDNIVLFLHIRLHILYVYLFTKQSYSRFEMLTFFSVKGTVW